MPKLLVLFTSFLLYVSGISQENIMLTYTGNMGVFISGGKSSVLIDGLHTKYGDDYLFPSKKLVDKITTDLKPNAILFTHYHGDHFSEQLTKEYLESNTKAFLFAASQVTKNFSEFGERVITIKTDNYSKQTSTLEEITITSLKINHAGERHISVENVGYIVRLNDKNILHVGDTNWLEEINLFDQLKLQEETIDIAILPYWMLLDDNALELIKKYINPKQVIATHISPRVKDKNLSELKERDPNIHFLNTLEQQIQL
ncbi:MBL fold metallo-hydrolase [Aquimarina algiphila]|uniref:MBL fold metallo-hydrolase n=1 Tax=Aquimarina algiphila TaxID=2047982 RepID=UPI00248F8F0E|nr:MBL fold metallo-hydrolase [Aquimarina algiphila]